MGIKLLILQTIPWCLPMMGNVSGCQHADQDFASPCPMAATAGRGATSGKDLKNFVKIILADGTVEVYHRPVSAGELMMEHPMHFVCRSDGFTIGQHIPALEEGEQLLPGHAYFLLPARFFQSVLSFVTLASAVAILQHRPFEVQKTPSGSLQIRLSVDVAEKEAREGEDEEGRWEGGGKVCTTAALEKDYRQLVAGSRVRQWKPKLETITESEKRRRGLVAFGDIGRREKKGHQRLKQQRQPQQEEAQGLQQEQPEQRRKQQKKQEPKVSNASLHIGSPHLRRSQGKKVVACDL